MKISDKYRIHRTLAIIAVPLLLLSTATGFFRANQKWFWEDGYKKKKQKEEVVVTRDLLPLSQLVQLIDSTSQKNNKFDEIQIRSESGTFYYFVSTANKNKYLVDAITGELVSPLSSELASLFAAQYVKEKAGIKSCELLNDYKPRKAKESKPAYRIQFDNTIHSEVYLDYTTGEIVEDIDDNRTFGLWIMRLHDYDFFDSKRSIASAVGISIFLVAISGLWIYRVRSMKTRNQAG